MSGGPLASVFGSYEFRPAATLIAAVSGGSDSTALLFLLKSHLSKHHPDTKLIAATVDHGLRAQSAVEAQDVARLCEMIGIQHFVLPWEGSKPTKGVQAAARLARHKLLADLATREGAAAVFTGHTRDDLAETVIMRNSRGEGPGGAGIAPATLFNGRVWFLRPLLNTSRDALREKLAAIGVGWVDDPSNSDVRFERVRVRLELNSARNGRELADRAVAAAQDAGALRMARGVWAASLLRRHADCQAPGLIRLGREILAAPDETLVLAIRALLAVQGGTEHLPNRQRVLALIEGMRSGSLRANLSRALIDARKDAVFILREGRNVPTLQPVEGEVWDNRFQIAAGQSGRRGESSREYSVPESLVRSAAKTTPNLPENAVAVPIIAPWRMFLPSFDLGLANEVAKLFGAETFPPLPFPRHIEKTF
ncbi:MAG: tRNA lysidine(34) synthetase TilS [Rhizobiaceae bacterium]|nr:tRNA lysidine(34) synthetase TilS [Rhizobiaceae bacterium]